MSGGLEEAARYEEQQMKEALETVKVTGRIKELNNNECGGYASLRNNIPAPPAPPAPPELPSFEKQADFFLNDALPTFKKYLEDSHPLQKVFDEVINQVSKGKGEERHGNGKEFIQQPWKDLCDTYGVGFAFGQAAKKLSESQGMTGETRKRELLGAIAYLAMGVMHENYLGK